MSVPIERITSDPSICHGKPCIRDLRYPVETLLELLCIPLIEEPQLTRRFGAADFEYCRHVPRVVPRLRPWVQGGAR